MMPLTFVNAGEEATIKKIGGKPETKKHLENLGFIVGGCVDVVNEQHGNIIVKVKETRVALSKETANKIFV